MAPYLIPIAPGVTNTSILTVDDEAANGYTMAGVPDGLGAYDNGHGTITLLMNHEMRPGAGAVHDHGADGALTASANGRQLILSEDPGNNPRQARVYAYTLRTDRLTAILEHDPALFTDDPGSVYGTDEESSGTIDVSRYFGRGSYLMTTQAHSSTRLGSTSASDELVEDRQLQLVRVPRTDNGQGSKRGH
ncbi:hypothetical protein [Microbacterium sp.]|uniref:hypothetical protein n=1 Tax=Microbacterium sp. TaxID=51671 RepID=UPI003A86F3DD